jgi:metal-responsive CopG/Arc/MetJ family transcriptional regulator
VPELNQESAMTDARQLLSDELLHEVEEAARAQNLKPSEVLEEAVRRYLEDRSWSKIFSYGRERGEAAGILTEEGVDRAITEYRKERGHGRS